MNKYLTAKQMKEKTDELIRLRKEKQEQKFQKQMDIIFEKIKAAETSINYKVVVNYIPEKVQDKLKELGYKIEYFENKFEDCYQYEISWKE